ncbi:MAG: PQQ-binding-like beta-propeller repeat protein, partial [Nitrospiraceae bacterium]|nr:PQQ-binding-like beta-propeller repeat protein [Nitrospiraceae bacterium]
MGFLETQQKGDMAMRSSQYGFLWAGAWLIVLVAAWQVAADDWPTYRHDNRRSGVTADVVEVGGLGVAWVHDPPYEPQPAWPGPAKWDAYARVIGLRAMRNYDPAFHTVIAGGRVYFGSSVDDAVHCLDAKTGEEVWRHTVGGPVRIAPTVSGGKVFFGADDGYAYCVDAEDGALVWKYTPKETSRRIPNNGKLISLWPVRTGVLVDSGHAYFGAALLPWREAFLCAVDAATGKPEGEGRFRQSLKSVTMEGALLASSTKLYVPQGRSAPMVFDRTSGTRLGDLEGGGGVFVMLTEDARVVHGPGNKTGWITESNAETRDKIASYPKGNRLLIRGDRAFVLTDEELMAIDRTNGQKVWTVMCKCPYDLILAGDV